MIQAGEAANLINIINNSWEEEAYSYTLTERNNVPEELLVATLNMRSILKELPKPPVDMQVEFSTFASSMGLTASEMNSKVFYGKQKCEKREILVEVTGESRRWNTFLLIDGMDILTISEAKPPLIVPNHTLEVLLKDIELWDILIDFTMASGEVFYPLLYSRVDEFLVEAFGNIL